MREVQAKWHDDQILAATVSLCVPFKRAQLYIGALTIYPPSPSLVNSLGNIYYTQGRYDDALRLYRRAASEAPDEAIFQSNIGDVLRAMQDYSGALTAYKAAGDAGIPAQLHAKLASVYLAQEKYTEAEQEYRQAGAAGNSGFNDVGNALYRASLYDKAIPLYREAICVTPGTAQLYDNLANSLNKTGDTSGAQVAWGVALGLSPAEPTFYFNIGEAAYTAHDYVTAAAAYQMALDLTSTDPNDPKREDYALNAGVAYLSMSPKMPAPALKALEVALEGATGDRLAYVKFYLARAYHEQNSSDPRACKIMAEALQLEEKSPTGSVRADAQTSRDTMSIWGCLP